MGQWRHGSLRGSLRLSQLCSAAPHRRDALPRMPGRPPQPGGVRAAADAPDRRRPARSPADRVRGAAGTTPSSNGRRTQRRLPLRAGRRASAAPRCRGSCSRLGALCLLVAAVIFLAVAWAWLGVGGRTAVLVALTLVTGGLGVTLGRRELRIAAEALTTVSLGLLALDVVGADNAGWLGDLSNATLVAITSAAVLTAALALSASTRLVAPQLIAAVAVSGVGLGAHRRDRAVAAGRRARGARVRRPRVPGRIHLAGGPAHRAPWWAAVGGGPGSPSPVWMRRPSTSPGAACGWRDTGTPSWRPPCWSCSPSSSTARPTPWSAVWSRSRPRC